MRIVVTGGSGKAGRAVVRDLLEHGHEVLNVDLVTSAESSSPDSPAPFLRADLTDFGQALEALGGGELMAHPREVQSNRRKALFPGPSSMELGGLEPPTSWVRSSFGGGRLVHAASPCIAMPHYKPNKRLSSVRLRPSSRCFRVRFVSPARHLRT